MPRNPLRRLQRRLNTGREHFFKTGRATAYGNGWLSCVQALRDSSTVMLSAAWSARKGKIAILLSTYNGSRYLCEQLNSFLAQTHEDWVLHWRDDGSTDETVEIMR